MRAFPRVLAVLAASVLAVVLLPTARSEAVMGQFIFDSANTSVYLSFSSATVGSFIFTSDPSSGRNFYIHHAGWAGNGEEEVYIETYNGLPVAGADCNGDLNLTTDTAETGTVWIVHYTNPPINFPEEFSDRHCAGSNYDSCPIADTGRAGVAEVVDCNHTTGNYWKKILS